VAPYSGEYGAKFKGVKCQYLGSKTEALTCGRRNRGHAVRAAIVVEPAAAPVPPTTIPVDAQRTRTAVRTAQIVTIETNQLSLETLGNLIAIVPADPERFDTEELLIFETVLGFCSGDVLFAAFQGIDSAEHRRIPAFRQRLSRSRNFPTLAYETDWVEGVDYFLSEGILSTSKSLCFIERNRSVVQLRHDVHNDSEHVLRHGQLLFKVQWRGTCHVARLYNIFGNIQRFVRVNSLPKCNRQESRIKIS
jgi:hypothetical protein